MLTHNFKIINDPSQWDEDMKNFFNSLAEYWLSIHPKPNRRWREEYAMKLYKQLNGDFIEIFARWKIYLQDGRFISATTVLNAAGNWKGI